MDVLTSNLLTDLLDKALECPVCLDQLDATARVLPCQHTFCRRCLLEIVHSRRELLCPECRVQCVTPIDELPPNILLIRLLEGIKSNRKPSGDRNDGQQQGINELLPLSSQTSTSMAGLSINQLFNKSQQQVITSQSTTKQSQPNQSQTIQQQHQQHVSQERNVVKQSQSSLRHSMEMLSTSIEEDEESQWSTEFARTAVIRKSLRENNHNYNNNNNTNNNNNNNHNNNINLKEVQNTCPPNETQQQQQSTNILYVALYNYRPQKKDELELRKGELYSVGQKCHDGWYKGVSLKSGTFGVFPGNYVQLAKMTVPVSQYHCAVNVSNVVTPQSIINVKPMSQNNQLSKEPPVLKPKPVLQSKPSINPVLGDTGVQSNTATDNATVYARPRPTGQPIYDMSRNLTSLVPPPPPTQRPSRPLSSIIVPNKPSVDPNSPQSQLAQAINQSLLISKQQSTSQSSLTQSTQWHQPKVAATRNTLSMISNTSITPPPNVSVVSSSSSSSMSTQSSHKPPIDKKEAKTKDKSNFIKRFTSGIPKRKNQLNTNNSFSCDNPSFVDTSPNSTNSTAPLHVRSGSCPNESFTESAAHKKQSSFDDSNTVIKNRMTSKTLMKEVSPQVSQPIGPPVVKERFRCVVPYPPNSDYELQLQIGDVVYVHKKREDGWYKGTLQRTGKTGLFPGPFVESF